MVATDKENEVADIIVQESGWSHNKALGYIQGVKCQQRGETLILEVGMDEDYVYGFQCGMNDSGINNNYQYAALIDGTQE